MDRREFLMGTGAASALSLLPLAGWAGANGGAAAAGAGTTTESGAALAELVAKLEEADELYLGPEFGITRAADKADGHRYLMHALQIGLHLHLESDPERPIFKRIVSPTQKSLGDNPDAIYYEAPIRGDRGYRVRGKVAGAVYVSFTVEGGAAGGAYPEGVVGTINSDEFTTAEDGSFEILLGPDVSGPNTLRLAPNARSLTTRHYFEEEASVAADPLRHVDLVITPTEDPGPAPTPDDASVAAAIRRVTAYVHGLTLGMGRAQDRPQESWVSTVPNVFNPPAKPGNMAFAAVDNAYTMAPYVLMPDEALEITGRFPKCRFANVVLWNRFLQSYDYLSRRISLNRAQTRLDADGRYRMVIAHQDPGVPNWIDTEGRVSGTVYWRFMLPEGEIETPRAVVRKLADIRAGA